MYEYQAKVIRVVDGDTIVVDIDLGLRIHTTQTLRLLGVNTPEIVGESRAAGLAAKHWLAERIEGKEVIINTHLDKNDKYGRLLATVFTGPLDTSINWQIGRELAKEKPFA